MSSEDPEKGPESELEAREVPEGGWTLEYDLQEPVVCVTHKRFLPCRPCDEMPGTGLKATTWSAMPDDVEMVRKYHSGEDM